MHQPVLTGREARRRLAITTTDPPTAGASVTLTVTAEALRDTFGNLASAAYTLTFPWPAADAVLEDTAAPELHEAVVENSRLVLRFSEPVDPASTAVQLDGSNVTWTASADGYTLTSTTTVASGAHTLSLQAQALDLSGQAPAVDSFDFTVSTGDGWIYQAPDPNRLTTSAALNHYGFHGRPVDPETGLMYFRNRYYDPEMGRFISTDPYGYIDGPSSYQYGLNSPSNYSDPTGEFVAIAATMALGGAVSAGMGYIASLISGEPYTGTDFAADFAAGAIGAGVGFKLAKFGGLVGGFVFRNVLDAEISTYAEIYKHEQKGKDYDSAAIFKHELKWSMFGDIAGALAKRFTSDFVPPSSMSKPKAEFSATQIYGGGNHVESEAAAVANTWRRAQTPAGSGCPFVRKCFAAGTLVATISGPVAIEAIEVGDLVWARNEITQQAELAEVVTLFEREVDEIWLLSAGETILETTDEHPFFVNGRGWTQAEDLEAGDLLVTLDGETLKLDSIERVERRDTVFNFEVRGLHNYFVGDDQVLVHNCGGGLPRGIRTYLKDVEEQTGRKIHQSQIEPLKQALRAERFSPMTKAEIARHRSAFNRVKNDLIEEWERNTGQAWPRYTQNVPKKSGEGFSKRVGDPYDAHHLIENKIGGPAEWWNIHPARFPDQHQGGIHRSRSPLRVLLENIAAAGRR